MWGGMGSCHGASSPGPGFSDPPQAIDISGCKPWADRSPRAPAVVEWEFALRSSSTTLRIPERRDK